MSISSLTHRVKNEVKCHGFWKKTSTAKTKETVSTYILSYLDETSKADAKAEACKLGYAAVQNGAPVAQEQGIDYLTKEEKGKIRAYGFLRDDVSALGGDHSHLLDNDARVIACHRAWMDRLGQHPGAKKFAHKYVFSLDPRFCELMGAAGRDCDALLVQGCRTVMRRFQEKFYPGDRLGYMVGIHHDRKHIHAHVLLFPYTENGVHLRVTDNDEDKRFGESRKVANKFVLEYFLKEFDNPIKASERPIDKVMQTRVVSFIAMTTFPKATLDESLKMAWVAGEKKRLLALPEAELRALLIKRHEALNVSFGDLVDKLEGKAADTKAVLQNIGKQKVDLKYKVQQVEGILKDVRARQQDNRVEFMAAQKGLANFRFFSSHAKGDGASAFAAGTPEQEKWLTDVMSNPALAESARVALTNQPLGQIIGGMHERGLMAGLLAINEKKVGRTRELLRSTFNIRLEELKAEREKIKAELDAAYSQREGLLVALDTNKVTETMATSAGKGRKPMFLEQFDGLKRAGVELPILCRPILPVDLAGCETATAAKSFEDLNKKIMNTLRAFQGAHTDGDVFEVDRYFRTITDAISPAKRQVEKEAAEAEVRRTLETQSVQDFLHAQNIRQSGSGAAAEAIMKHVKSTPGFDL